MIDFSNFTRIATAAVGALVLSTAFITAAVGPAASAQPSEALHVAAQSSVSAQAQV